MRPNKAGSTVKSPGRAYSVGHGLRGGCTLALAAFFLCRATPAAEEIPARMLTYVKTPNTNFKPEIGKFGGRMVQATFTDPKSFNPIIAMETSTTEITGYIFEGLTRTDGVTTRVVPSLAKSWEVDKEGTTWTFHLREDVLWNDGHPFTADDVVFTFDLIYDDKIPTSSRDLFTIEGKKIAVEKVDDRTVVFKLPTRYAPFLMSLSQEIVPKHILEKPWKEGKFNTTWSVRTPPDQIVGTGPYMLKSYSPQERIVLTRNPHYWKRDAAGNRLPYIDEVVYVIVLDQQVELMKFKSGETDYHSLRGEEVKDLAPLQKKHNFTIYALGPDFGEQFIYFNMHPGSNPQTKKPYVEPHKLKWFTNVKFRQAIAHAMDKQSMIDIVLDGFGYEQWGPMSPKAGFFYNPNTHKYPYDLRKTRALLGDIGFADRDGDGILEDADGHKLEFRLYTNSGNQNREKIANIIRKDLQKVGIKVFLQLLEFNYLVSILDGSMDYDAILLGLTGSIEPHFAVNVWKSSGHLHMWYPKQETPATPWEKRIDEIFDQAVQELNPDKRKVLYDEWQVIVSENCPLIYTVLQESLVALRNRFGNLNPAPYGGLFHNLEEIYIKPEGGN